MLQPNNPPTRAFRNSNVHINVDKLSGRPLLKSQLEGPRTLGSRNADPINWPSLRSAWGPRDLTRKFIADSNMSAVIRHERNRCCQWPRHGSRQPRQAPPLTAHLMAIRWRWLLITASTHFPPVMRQLLPALSDESSHHLNAKDNKWIENLEEHTTPSTPTYFSSASYMTNLFFGRKQGAQKDIVILHLQRSNLYNTKFSTNHLLRVQR